MSVRFLFLSILISWLVCLCSPGCECLLLTRIPSVSWLVHLSALSRMWVPLAHSDSFHVLTCLSICALQDVSAPCSLGFLLCPDLSICLHSSVCECPLLTQIPSMSWLVCPSVLFREWVPLICSLSVSSLLSFSVSKALLSKLSTFFSKVLLLFYSFIFVLPTHFQPPLSISSDDHIHHKLIGTFLLSASVISDIKNSGNPHSWTCMSFLCLTIYTN